MFELLKAVIFVGLVGVAPQLTVNWADSSHSGVKVAVSGSDATIEQCVKSGLAVHYRYEMRLCRRRAAWMDRCTPTTIEVHSLQFEPISEVYTMMSDRHNDTDEPVDNRYTSFNEAMQQTSRIALMPLSFLNRDGQFFADVDLSNEEARKQAYQGIYVGVRLLAECRGDYNQILGKLSYFLTLGLLRTGVYDSGWVDFQLGA